MKAAAGVGSAVAAPDDGCIGVEAGDVRGDSASKDSIEDSDDDDDETDDTDDPPFDTAFGPTGGAKTEGGSPLLEAPLL